MMSGRRGGGKEGGMGEDLGIKNLLPRTIDRWHRIKEKIGRERGRERAGR